VGFWLETPYTFFAHFGQTGKDIYRMLRNAQDHQEIMARDVAEKVHQILGDAKTGIRENAVTSMNEEVHHFTTTESHELDLTTAQAMELYLLSERKQAEDHLLKGGIVQPEIKIPGKTKIPRGTDVIHLSAEDIQSIVKVLTPEQIRIADGLQKLTTGVLANYGNEASMKAYGYKKFTEQDYWPIKSAKEALHSSQEKDSGNVRSIKNIGMAQAVKPNIKRDAMAAVRTAVQATGSVALEYEFEKFTYNIYSTANKSRYLNLAFKALEQGDLTTYEHIRKELKDFMALDNSSVDSSMRSKLDKERENDEDFRLPDAAASLIGAKDRYGTGEGEDKFTENDLSSDDYIVYSRRKSELYSSMESGLEDSQVFRAFTDEQKDKALSSAETYAKKTALHETDKTYEITDKWVLNAQEAQQKYNISPWVYVALKTQVSGLESMKDRNGDTIPNSKSLLIMQAIYKTKGLHEYQKKALFEYMGVGKSIWHLNQSAVDEAIVRNEKKAGK
jgi:hypothetical protein